MHKLKFFAVYFLIVIVPIILFDKESNATGVMLDSIGAVSSGRGGTNIAHSDNGVLIHDNPAAFPLGTAISGVINGKNGQPTWRQSLI